MGIRISKDHLHPSVIESITSLIGDLSQLETTAKGNAVEAINELLANGGNKEELEALIAEIENGKELIANAVGEPLTAEDSFNEMSNDINSLLSTFKTNMMNNGVTVNSSDKFKALIDKIATLADNEGKGIQYAEGSISKLSVGVTGNLPTKKTIPYTTLGLDFKPTILFIYVDTITGGSTDYFKETVNSMDNYSDATSCHGQYYNGSYFMHRMYISNITDNSFDLYTYTDLSESRFEVFLNNVKWYVIGVGEEDTTLRDSLASILEEEGVNVTEEDTMADLITKVDEEFDRKNANSGLDIISATELPATGKENQICVITDNPEGSFLITNIESDTNSNGFLVYNTNNTSITPISITNGNIAQTYRITYVKQGTQYLATYIWSNGVWNVMTNANLILLENGAFKNTDISGGFNTGTYHTLTSDYLKILADTNGVYYTRASFKNQIDFTYYNTLKITLKSSNSKNLPLRLYSGSACTSSRPSGQAGSKAVTATATSSKQTLTLDITSWQGLGYLNLESGYDVNASGIYVYYIELY